MPFKEIPPNYSIWQGMLGRCRNPNYRQWNDYGGRGITVCERWRNSYHAFAADMGERPAGYSLDRIDNDAGYSPENCRWASRGTQQRNRRRAVYVTVDGQQYRAVELAERAGVKTDTIIERANRGLPLAQVMAAEKLQNLSGLSLGGAANGARQRSKTHCPNGHEYTSDNLRASSQGYRGCKACHREREKARRRRNLPH
jgi:hypothetical protein